MIPPQDRSRFEDVDADRYLPVGRDARCPWCGKQRASAAQLRRHLSNKHPREVWPLIEFVRTSRTGFRGRWRVVR